MSFDETIKINYEDVNKNIIIRFEGSLKGIKYTLVEEKDLENEKTGLITDLLDFEKIENTSEKIMYLLNSLKEQKII
jgi:hypothetical protein